MGCRSCTGRGRWQEHRQYHARRTRDYVSRYETVVRSFIPMTCLWWVCSVYCGTPGWWRKPIFHIISTSQTAAVRFTEKAGDIISRICA